MNSLEKAKKLKVLAIGETIIDEYIFVKATGRASKDPILSTQYVGKEQYLGGILAPARHLANFVEKVHVISLVGDQDNYVNQIKGDLPSNISTTFFQKKNSPTIIKQRFVEPHHYRKLFKTEYINDKPIEKELTNQIINFIEQKRNEYDYILVNDFGHGFINGKISKYLSSIENFLAINVQSNSSNYGFNPPTKFPRANYLTLNTGELLLLYRTKEENHEELLRKLGTQEQYNQILLTAGKQGVIHYAKGKSTTAPALVTSPVDTIGAGDAVFSLTSILAFQEENPQIITSYANAIGAAAVNIIGNKESVTKEMIEKYIQ